MPQFLLLAHDGTDPEAEARRLAARPGHLARIAPLVESGAMILGGAILNHAGRMVGSACIVEFPDLVALNDWLSEEPYITEGVWQRVEIQPFRVAVERTGRPD